jgi:hypothetical protein
VVIGFLILFDSLLETRKNRQGWYVHEGVRVPVVAEQIVPAGGSHPALSTGVLPKLRRSPKTP